ncbi:MAG: hypothetical protein HY692_06135 [Cyanobacteria bacterium NC_groundwater_1444_Ag_S-0.65um_54_12]|nr:hypothetical protein [Cyanobacteria bacterium NC_groundwater_1444_Ag_S-0.65um_54_12]
MYRLLLVLGLSWLATSCMPVIWRVDGETAASQSAERQLGNEDLLRDPIILTGTIGFGLLMLGGVAGLLAYQTERDKAQIDSPLVTYGWPIFKIGMGLGLPIYLGSYLAAEWRLMEQQQKRLALPTSSHP